MSVTQSEIKLNLGKLYKLSSGVVAQYIGRWEDRHYGFNCLNKPDESIFFLTEDEALNAVLADINLMLFVEIADDKILQASPTWDGLSLNSQEYRRHSEYSLVAFIGEYGDKHVTIQCSCSSKPFSLSQIQDLIYASPDELIQSTLDYWNSAELVATSR